MNNPKERTAWIKAQEAAADEDPHGYPEPGEPNESTEERMQRFFFQQMTEGNATADGDGAQLLTVTITLAEYRRLAQQDGKLEYLQEQLDKKEEALTFMYQKSIEDYKAASNYRRQIEDLTPQQRQWKQNRSRSVSQSLRTRPLRLPPTRPCLSLWPKCPPNQRNLKLPCPHQPSKARRKPRPKKRVERAKLCRQ